MCPKSIKHAQIVWKSFSTHSGLHEVLWVNIKQTNKVNYWAEWRVCWKIFHNDEAFLQKPNAQFWEAAICRTDVSAPSFFIWGFSRTQNEQEFSVLLWHLAVQSWPKSQRRAVKFSRVTLLLSVWFIVVQLCFQFISGRICKASNVVLLCEKLFVCLEVVRSHVVLLSVWRHI